MVGTSKILTVSYGTFSCTLEGFDDSFNTMKAIAEYFRDLASDDRYFGAEPPTPDAEMLARIAEKEIARRVEARMDASGVVLRPALSEERVEMPEPTMAEQTEGKTESKADTSAMAIAAAVSATAQTPRHEDDAPKPEATPKEDATAEVEDVAAAPVEQVDTDSQHEDTVSDAPVTAEAEESDAGLDAEAEAQSPASLLVASDPVIAPEPEAPSAVMAEDTGAARGDVAEDASDAEPAAPVVDTPAVPAHPDADSVAAKLQRIRAVVSSSGQSDETADYAEDLTMNGATADALPDVADHEDATPEVAAQEATPPGADMISRVMALHDEADETGEEADDSDTSDTDAQIAEADPDAEPVEAPRPRVVRVKRADLEAVVAQQAADIAADKAKTSDASKDDDTATETAEPEQAVGLDTPDLGLLDGADELEGYLEDSDEVSLSTDADADLMEALGDELDENLDDDLSDNSDDAIGAPDAQSDEPETIDAAEAVPAETADDTTEEADADSPARAAFSTDPDADEDSINRLLDQTDAQLREPEGNRRRAAIAQLKAAVAATQAERGTTDQPDDGDDDEAEVENAFRDDLEQVVRPRRAPRHPVVEGQATRTERPRPAPLKLVAAQRVDLPGDEAKTPVTPVRPRRVQARIEATKNNANSFAEFAQKADARELADLLEAAAAYTSFVEGAEEFSRPQIMRRVRQFSPESFNREDGLRTFADLLRQGRFTKVRNGRFQVAEDTRFHPERQAS